MKLWRSGTYQISKQSRMPFQRYFKTVILGTLGMPEQTHLKLWQNFRTLIDLISEFHLSPKLHKNQQTTNEKYKISYPMNFGHARPHPPKRKVSICRKIWLLSLCKIFNFITGFLREKLHFEAFCNHWLRAFRSITQNHEFS